MGSHPRGNGPHEVEKTETESCENTCHSNKLLWKQGNEIGLAAKSIA